MPALISSTVWLSKIHSCSPWPQINVHNFRLKGLYLHHFHIIILPVPFRECEISINKFLTGTHTSTCRYTVIYMYIHVLGCINVHYVLRVCDSIDLNTTIQASHVKYEWYYNYLAQDYRLSLSNMHLDSYTSCNVSLYSSILELCKCNMVKGMCWIIRLRTEY